MKILFLLIFWSPPVNLGIPGVDDVNPQGCRTELFRPGCLVWETNVDGNWDIFSRIITNTQWTDTLRITSSINNDKRPSVAYDYFRNRFWCVWENDSGSNPKLYITYYDSTVGWSSPVRLTTDTLYDENPSIAVIKDTVWVVWKKGYAFGDTILFYHIISRFYDGTGWSGEIPVIADSMINLTPKINARYNHPFVVWFKDGDIYYSEFINNSWQTPQTIVASPEHETDPDIAVYIDPFYYNTQGVWVTWISDTTGNFEVYSTGYDSFSTHYQITTAPSFDLEPSPLYYHQFITRGGPTCIAFATNRNGNYDIYSHFTYYGGGGYTMPVDLNPSSDFNPVMTETGWIWVLWETDRNGDWDIYGSFISHGDVEEKYTQNLNRILYFNAYPNPFTEMVKLQFKIEKRYTEKSSDLVLKIYDSSGRLIKSFSNIGGLSEVNWDGNCENGVRAVSGVYFARLTCGRVSVVNKLTKLEER